MFDSLAFAPPDSILGLTEAFRKDPNPRKINLSVGVFKDAAGSTPILRSVKEAERRLLDAEQNKGYLPIEGHPEYAARVQELLFGSAHEIQSSRRAVTAQTPGGTGALRVAADFLRKHFPHATVWHSKPTWANHPAIFAAAGLGVQSYAYIDGANQALDFPAMLAALGEIPRGDVVLLHACCHNPTGIDPTPEQWQEIAAVVHERGLLPLVDFAYQGFGDGLVEDAAGLAALARPGKELLICSSYSKNFGLYGERVGALTLVADSPESAERALSQLRVAIRTNYSNPPTHGAAIVATVLSDRELRSDWETELAAMRERIHAMRQLFVRTMKSKAPQLDFSFLGSQKGMFSFSGLSNLQVDELRTKHSVYVVGNGGRINVAGITEQNIDPLTTAIAAVLQ
ncbi:MAG: aspartate/tyrosine/aromatic aminotransferase [Pirellulaceae bacterium]|jgi:aspartate/tyrosine/aromatic aminotransferase|nr:aspartate/tyrosine/aromatic aminotransferase [Pirellulaceae bacterium]